MDQHWASKFKVHDAEFKVELELEQYPLVTISFTKTLYIPKGWLSE